MSKRKPDDWQPKTVYRTGVWWLISDNFGPVTIESDNAEKASCIREQLLREGYGKPGISEPRTIKVTTERIA